MELAVLQRQLVAIQRSIEELRNKQENSQRQEILGLDNAQQCKDVKIINACVEHPTHNYDLRQPPPVYFLRDGNVGTETKEKSHTPPIPTNMLLSTDCNAFVVPKRQENPSPEAISFHKDFETAPLLHLFIHREGIDVALAVNFPHLVKQEIDLREKNHPSKTNKSVVKLLRHAKKEGNSFIQSKTNVVKTRPLDSMISLLEDISKGIKGTTVKKAIESGERDNIAKVLSTLPARKRKDYVSNLKGKKKILEAARNTRFLDPKILRYLKDIQDHYDKKRSTEELKAEVFSATASLYKNHLVTLLPSLWPASLSYRC
jgi:hypothetical protein